MKRNAHEKLWPPKLTQVFAPAVELELVYSQFGEAKYSVHEIVLGVILGVGAAGSAGAPNARGRRTSCRCFSDIILV